jgi:hypothetical protein
VDEVGLDPSPALGGPDEAGGVPQNPHNFHDHIAGTIPYAEHAEPDPTEVQIGSEIGSGGAEGRGDRWETVTNTRMRVTEARVGVTGTRAGVTIHPSMSETR